jgi:beta-lactamase superfamily II metal-dependent hydrolase
VLLLTYGKHRFLLTGDMEKEVEWQLLDGGRLRPVDVLKVAHHGSRTSSTDEFLRATAPSLAIVSVGEDNPYRLPSREVVERFREQNVALLRTDTLGLATVTSDGQKLSFSVQQWARARY